MHRTHNRDNIKKAVRARDGYRCTKCGETNEQHRQRRGRQLQVHRIQPGSVYAVDGCVTLCCRCHGAEPKSPAGSVTETPRAFFWLDPDLAEAFNAYIASTTPRVSKTAAYETAIREFLERQGFWPPEGGA